MKINFDAVIARLDGEPLMVPTSGEDLKPMTLAWVAVEALLWFNPAQPAVDSGEVKARCAHLAMRIYKGGEQELSAEDITVLKQKIGVNIASPLVVGVAYSCLEQRRIGEA